ncbi:MAG: hypothetical protein WC712_12445 [Candidatus Brocadiia bacterium]
MRYFALGLTAFFLLFVGLVPANGEDKLPRYEFDPPGEVRIDTWFATRSSQTTYSCPMLPGKRVVIPEGWKWGVQLDDPAAPHLSVLKEHLLARRANSIDIGHDITKEDLDVLAAMPWLEDITLSSVRITESKLAVLDGCHSLEKLTFNFCPFDDRAVEGLKSLKSKAQISFVDCRLSDVQLAALQGNEKIRSFCLKDVPAGWKGFESLTAIPNMEFLSLHGSFTEADALRLKPMAGLTRLHLDSPAFSTGCPDLLAGIAGLRFVAVTCKGSPEKLLVACANLPRLISLTLQGARFDEPSIKALMSLKNLVGLDLEKCTGLTPAALEQRGNLEWLYAEADLLRKVSPEQAKELKALKYLRVYGTIGEAEAKFFGGLQDLQELTIDEEITPEGAQFLSKALSGLRDLTVCGSLDDMRMQPLFDLAGLTGLHLQDAGALSKAGLALVGKLAKLRKLDIWGASNVIDDSFVDVLLKLPGLEYASLGVSSGITLEGLKKLATLPELTAFISAGIGLRGERMSRVHLDFLRLIAGIRGEHGYPGTNFPGSGLFTPDKWPSWPGKGDMLYGYRFKYVSNAVFPMASNGTRFAFLVVPTTLESGTVAYLGPSLSISCFKSETLSSASISRLAAVTNADVLGGMPNGEDSWSVNGVPFHPMK